MPLRNLYIKNTDFWGFGTKLLCGAATDKENGIFSNHLGINAPFDLSYMKTLFFFGDIILVLNRDFKVTKGGGVTNKNTKPYRLFEFAFSYCIESEEDTQ